MKIQIASSTGYSVVMDSSELSLLFTEPYIASIMKQLDNDANIIAAGTIEDIVLLYQRAVLLAVDINDPTYVETSAFVSAVRTQLRLIDMMRSVITERSNDCTHPVTLTVEPARRAALITQYI